MFRCHSASAPAVARRCLWLVLVSVLMAFPGRGYPAGPLENVLVVSIDALHPAALNSQTSPAVFALMEDGIAILDGKSTSPPLTLLAHTAMFTGLTPDETGRISNDWQETQERVSHETFFNVARDLGFTTGFFYSKSKLGYLVNQAIDAAGFSPEFAVEEAEAFMRTPGRHFCFLHISGLDRTGPAEGWLSPGYLEELGYLDEGIRPLIESLRERGNYLIVVTSDHAGHGRLHGTTHPEDALVPLVVCSDIIDLEGLKGSRYSVIGLKPLLETMLTNGTVVSFSK